MVDTNINTAFDALADAMTSTESAIHEEIAAIEQHIEQLRARIVELHEKQQTLTHDREAIAEMYSRYCADGANGA